MAALFVGRVPRVLAVATALAVSITCTDSVVTAPRSLDGSSAQLADVPITVSLPREEISVGDTVRARATVQTRRLQRLLRKGERIVWTSSDTAVVTVRPNTGLVRGWGPGVARVIASLGGMSGHAFITVSTDRRAVASIQVALAAAIINAGSTTTATATLRDSSGMPLSDRDIAWTSSDPAVAVVDDTGGLLALASGTAQIIATSEGVSGSATLTVNSPSTSVSVTLDASSIAVGGTTSASATVRDASGQPVPDCAVTWSSSDAAIATVDASGAVSGLREGTVSIRATCDGITGTAQLTVTRVSVASVTVTLDASAITVGANTRASAELRDASGGVLTGRAVAWSSSNVTVAAVSSSGLVTGIAPGTASIRATSEGMSGESGITVTVVPVTSVTVTISSPSLLVGQSTNASAVARDAGGNVITGRAVAWSSSSAAVAVVTSTGTVTAAAVGTADILGTVAGITGRATVSVSAQPPPSGGALAFASDWSTATGNSAVAIGDGGRWDDYDTGVSRLTIVPAAGLDFPTGMLNVVQGRYRESEMTYWIIQKLNGWSLPPVGGSLYKRLYFRHTLVGTSNSFHPVEPEVGACAYENNWTLTGTNPFSFQVRSSEHRWEVRLPRGQTYRVEERYERTGINTWVMHVRVYNSAGVLVATEADFTCVLGHGQHTMADRPTSTIAAECMRSQNINWQGGGGGKGSDDENNNRIFYGGFAVSLTGWIGPYVAGEATPP